MTGDDGFMLSVTVCLDGKAMPAGAPIKRIEVVREAGRQGSARIVLVGDDPSMQAGSTSERAMFDPGVPVQVRLGHGRDTSAVFEGVIARHGLRSDGDGWVELVLTCIEAADQVVGGDDTGLAAGEPAPAASRCGLRLVYGESIHAFDVETSDGPGSASGTVRSRGSALAVPGKTLELAGMGARFDGDVLIARVQHRVELGDWFTEVGFGVPRKQPG